MKEESNKELSYLYGFIFFFFAVSLSVIAGFRPLEFFRDTAVYLDIIHSDINMWSMEPTVWLINKINTALGGKDQGFFFIYAILGVSLKAYAIKKISPLPLLSLYLYVCLYFVLHEMTQIRVGVACGIFLLALPDLANRNYKGYLLKSVIAILFHYSAVIMLVLYCLRADKISKLLYCALPLLGITISAFPDLVLSFFKLSIFFLPDFLGSKVGIYLSLINDEGFNKINIFNFFVLSLMCFYYFVIFNIKKFSIGVEFLLIKLFGLQLFVYYSLSAVPAFSIRLSEFLGVCLIITLPYLVLIFKDKLLPTVFFMLWGAGYFFYISIGRLINLD